MRYDPMAPAPRDGSEAADGTAGGPRRSLPATESGYTSSGAGSGGQPLEVLLVEDSRIVRERLAGLVSELPNVTIVGQAEDGIQARTLFERHRPGAVMLDLELPGVHGTELLAEFKNEHPACTVIVLTTYALSEFRKRCAALGADYFFDKSTEFEEAVGVLARLTPGPGNEGPDGN